MSFSSIFGHTQVDKAKLTISLSSGLEDRLLATERFVSFP